MNIFKTFIASILLLSGCLTVRFETPQPQNKSILKQFPKNIRGTYLVEEDTVWVDRFEFSYPEEGQLSDTSQSHDSLSSTRVIISEYLSDSLVLKRFGKRLILNRKEEGEEYWDVYLIEKKFNRNLNVFTISNLETDDSEKDQIGNEPALKDFYEITKFEKLGEKDYLLNPSKREFMKLIERGLFSDTIRFYRVKK